MLAFGFTLGDKIRRVHGAARRALVGSHWGDITKGPNHRHTLCSLPSVQSNKWHQCLQGV